MAIKSALLAAITTVVLVLALGNGWARDLATDGGRFALQTRTTVTGQLDFRVWDMPSEIRTATSVRLVLLVLLAAVLGGIVGRSRPLAAFVGGWGAFLAASVVSAGVYGLVVDDRFVRPGSDAVDSFSATASFGAPLGIWLGWLVGLAVLLGSLGKGQPKPATRTPRPPTASWDTPPRAGAPWPDAPRSDAPQPDAAPTWDRPPDPTGTPPSGTGPSSPPVPPPSSGSPVIGTPPDRTQVFGEPPARDQ